MNKKQIKGLIYFILAQTMFANIDSVKLDDTVITSNSFGTKVLETAKILLL